MNKSAGRWGAYIALALFAALLLDRPGSSQFPGQSATATGVAGTNTITATLANITAYADVKNVPIKIPLAGANTGKTTLNLNSFGAIAVQRIVPTGLAELAGGEMVAGIAVVMYDGTVFELQNSAAPQPPGAIMDYAGAAGCPVGWKEATGASFVTTDFPALNSVLSTTWGVAGTLPDLNNRATFGKGNGSNRITIAGGNFDGSAVGNVGGQQGQASGIDKSFLKSFALSVTDPGHLHTYNFNSAAVAGGGPGSVTQTVTAGTNNPSSTNTTGITVNSGGSGTAFPTLSNGAIVLKCVRA